MIVFSSRYTQREFSEPTGDENAIYSIPRDFQKNGERQATLAEEMVFSKLHGLVNSYHVRGLWMAFFHSASYAGYSFRNRRDGKLMIREHDFVLFVKYKGKHFQ